MKNYHVNRYLNVIDLEENKLLLNGFNGCIDEVGDELGEILINNKIISKEIEDIDDETIDYLQKRGHITQMSEEQQKEQFKKFVKVIDDRNLEQSKKRGSLMFLMSYECNLKCFYCYQSSLQGKNLKKTMTPEDVDDIFKKYFDSLMNGVDKDNISITLYGGEPFLPKNRKTVERILNYAEKHNIFVSSISNCTYIDEFLDLLGPLPGQINMVQASLDGDKDNHDNSRIGSNRRPTFDKIIENIHRILDKKVRLSIRVNIESEGIGTLQGLYERLKREEIIEHPFANPYVFPLHNHYDQADDETFLTYGDATDILKEVLEDTGISHPLHREAGGLRRLLNMKSGIPFSRTRFCMMETPNSYLIDPYLEIYGCYEEAGREQTKIGELKDGKALFNYKKERNHKRSIMNMEKCMECSVALLCGGECAVQGMEVTGDIFKPYCNDKKEVIQKAVKYMYENKNSRNVATDFDMKFPNL